MPTQPTTAQTARARLEELLDSLDPETLAALQSGAIFDDDASDADAPASAPAHPPATPRDHPAREPRKADHQTPAAARGASGSDGEAVPDVETSPTRERAWTLHCHGMRSPHIAEELGVPARTVRHWLARDRAARDAGLAGLRREQALAAVDGLRAALATAWAAYEDERATEAEFAQATRRAFRVRELTPRDAASAPFPPRRPSHAARYLSLILRAQSDLIRLLGLSHTLLDNPTPAPPPTPPPTIGMPAGLAHLHKRPDTSAKPAIAAKTAIAEIPAPAHLVGPHQLAASVPPRSAAASPLPVENAARTATAAAPAPPAAAHGLVPISPLDKNAARTANTANTATPQAQPRDRTPSASPHPTDHIIAAKTASATPRPPSPSASQRQGGRQRPSAEHAVDVRGVEGRGVRASIRAPSARQRRKAARMANAPVLIRPRPAP